MTRRTSIIGAFLLLSAALQYWVHAQNDPSRPPSLLERGAAAPELGATALDGTSASLADLHGKVVILDFWATWCAPCRAEFRALDQWWKRESQTGLADDVVVLAVNCGEPRELVRRFVEKNPLPFRVVLDESNALSGRYRVESIPTLVVIGRDGKVIASMAGYDPSIGMVLSGLLRESLTREEKS